MTGLANAVLPLIRTRADLHRWSAANAHGTQMHHAVDVLEAAIGIDDPAEVYAVTHKALAGSLKVIRRADDSSGIIGDACRRLLALHPKAAADAAVPPAKLVDWMIAFQFDNEVDYFTIDIVAYAPALGDRGITAYRTKLQQVAVQLGPRPDTDSTWPSPHSHEWFTLDLNAQRLAVLDRDIAQIIRTHARDRTVAAWLQDTAEALAEIGEIDLAIDWARQGADHDRGHQSQRAADYWCQLLATHRPQDLLPARQEVFRRWPSARTAAALHRAAGARWPEYAEAVTTALAECPEEAVRFAQTTLKDVPLAWRLAHSLGLDSDLVWGELAAAYEKHDAVATLPIHTRLVEHELIDAGAQHYRRAARRLARMRKLAADTTAATEIDDLVAQLRQEHRRRPRLQQEFDRAGLP